MSDDLKKFLEMGKSIQRDLDELGVTQPPAPSQTKAGFERALVKLDRAYPGKVTLLLEGAIRMYIEYVEVHDYSQEAAVWAAIHEMVSGSEAMIELDDHGEL